MQTPSKSSTRIEIVPSCHSPSRAEMVLSGASRCSLHRKDARVEGVSPSCSPAGLFSSRGGRARPCWRRLTPLTVNSGRPATGTTISGCAMTIVRREPVAVPPAVLDVLHTAANRLLAQVRPGTADGRYVQRHVSRFVSDSPRRRAQSIRRGNLRRERGSAFSTLFSTILRWDARRRTRRDRSEMAADVRG